MSTRVIAKCVADLIYQDGTQERFAKAGETITISSEIADALITQPVPPITVIDVIESKPKKAP